MRWREARWASHLCYELHLPCESTDADAEALVAALRDCALGLPFDAVSTVVRLDEHTMSGPSPIRGLTYDGLEDVAHHSALWARHELYRRRMGIPDEDEYTRVDTPPDLPVLAYGFAVAPGRGSEPASFGLSRLTDGQPSQWWWHRCCKTQYASNLGDEHLLRCHGSLVSLLDAAIELGFEVVVRDETGFWESRDPRTLIDAVAEMNRIVARFAGTFVDAVRDAGGDSRQVGGAIFEHPEFERLESPARDRPPIRDDG
jgi:hypothetical protein